MITMNQAYLSCRLLLWETEGELRKEFPVSWAGSGVIVKFFDRHFVVTALHVLKYAVARLLVPGRNGEPTFLPIDLRSVPTHVDGIEAEHMLAADLVLLRVESKFRFSEPVFDLSAPDADWYHWILLPSRSHFNTIGYPDVPGKTYVDYEPVVVHDRPTLVRSLYERPTDHRHVHHAKITEVIDHVGPGHRVRLSNDCDLNGLCGSPVFQSHDGVEARFAGITVLGGGGRTGFIDSAVLYHSLKKVLATT